MFSKDRLLLTVLCIGSLGLAIGLLSLWRVHQIANRIALTTPVLILDRSAHLHALPEGSAPETRQQLLLELKQRADRYAREGYLVIDGGWVLAAPEELYDH